MYNMGMHVCVCVCVLKSISVFFTNTLNILMHR